MKAAVAAKLLPGRYVKARGKRADSAPLTASGSGAVLSASILLRYMADPANN